MEIYDDEDSRYSETSLFQKFSDLFSLFNIINIKLNKRTDFDDSEILELQKDMDHFGEMYMDVTSGERITNYIHYMISGHFRDMLFIHRNLWKFSQQGWESVNGLLKQYIFRRTQRGGSSGNGGKAGKVRIDNLFYFFFFPQRLFL